jgi:GntR family transcriptional regulator, transcriptional repressor for pyruvate dehydrogenase complex
MAHLFSPMKKQRASDEARELILSVIREGHLQAGEQLPSETQMAEQMGMSRVPVREAVSSLEQFGLLTVKRGSGGGIFIAEPTIEPFCRFFTLLLSLGKANIQELTEFRLLIEPGLAALAAQKAGPEHIAQLRQAIDDYRASVQEGKPRSIKDMDFHVILSVASQNLVLEMVVKGLVPLLHKSVKDMRFEPADRMEGIRDHERILAAVERRNPSAAQRTMADHVKRMATYWK